MASQTREIKKSVALSKPNPDILLDYKVARFFADVEALYSYEGTFQMQNLIVGKEITGLSAFV